MAKKYFNKSLLNQYIKNEDTIKFILELVNKPQDYSSFVKERTFDEIALLLGVSKQRAEQLFQSGIKKLKTINLKNFKDYTDYVK